MKRQSFGIALGYGFVIRGGFRNLSGDRRSRAIRAVRSLPLCKRCRTCEAPGVSTARAILWGSRPRGVEGQPQKSSMRRMTRSGLPPALRIAHRLRVADGQQEYGGSRVLGGFEMARLHSLRGLVTKGPAREESDASVFSPTLRGGRPEEGWGRLSQPFAPSPLARRFLGGEGCYVLTDCRRSRSSPSAAAEAGSGSLHHLCRCHKSTSRLT